MKFTPFDCNDVTFISKHATVSRGEEIFAAL